MQRYFLSIKAFLLCTAAAAVLLISGCGSDDSTASSGAAGVTVETGSLSKAEFIAQANEICTEGRSQIEQKFFSELKRDDSGTVDAEGSILASTKTTIVPGYEEWVEEISDLGAPSGEEEAVAKFLNTLQLRLDEINADPTEMTTTATPFEKVTGSAEAAGLSGCAQALS
jgi:hypothetical protein